MNIDIVNRSFQGPYSYPDEIDSINDESATYVVLGAQDDGEWDMNQLIDFGHSETVKSCIASHDRVECWQSQGYSKLGIAVYYGNEKVRKLNVELIELSYSPVCK